MKPILATNSLNVSLYGKTLVEQLSLELMPNKTLALVGESGSGKTITSLAITRLVPEMQLSGSIHFLGNELARYSDDEIRTLRGGQIGYIFQEPLSALNPLHRVHKQIGELLEVHRYPNNRSERIAELLAMVGLDPSKMLRKFQHELSGGQRQRVMIAMALANQPQLLIADEPTTALDFHLRISILDLIKKLQQQLGIAVLLISHDLELVRSYADTVAIMHRGRIIESGATKRIFADPQHHYTRNLLLPLAASAVAKPKQPQPLLQVQSLSISYPIKRGVFKRTVDRYKVIESLSFSLETGTTLGLVGPSGSGKSSVALAILQMIAYQGSIEYKGKRLATLQRKEMRLLRRNIQIVFQDPFSSLNPRMTLAQILAEGLKLHITKDAQQLEHLSKKALAQVGLHGDLLGRYPHQFSGGQRQRIALARVLALKPQLVILDEPTSSIDRSNQRQIIELLRDLQQQHGISYLFISHDLEAVEALSHKVIQLETRENQVVDKHY